MGVPRENEVSVRSDNETLKNPPHYSIGLLTSVTDIAVGVQESRAKNPSASRCGVDP